MQQHNAIGHSINSFRDGQKPATGGPDGAIIFMSTLQCGTARQVLMKVQISGTSPKLICHSGRVDLCVYRENTFKQYTKQEKRGSQSTDAVSKAVAV